VGTSTANLLQHHHWGHGSAPYDKRVTDDADGRVRIRGRDRDKRVGTNHAHAVPIRAPGCENRSGPARRSLSFSCAQVATDATRCGAQPPHQPVRRCRSANRPAGSTCPACAESSPPRQLAQRRAAPGSTVCPPPSAGKLPAVLFAKYACPPGPASRPRPG